MTMARVAFLTCVELGFACIQEIGSSGFRLKAVITLDDAKGQKKSGRIFLDDYCESEGLPLFKISHINERSSVELIKSLKLDWLFIIGWSQIASEEVLSVLKFGAIGAHPTLLPKGRGRAAIPWTIIHELSESGVTFFKIDAGVDSGPIIAQESFKVPPTASAKWLYEKVSATHRSISKQIVQDIVDDRIEYTEQLDQEATYWPERRPSDGEINLLASVYEAEKLIRAVTHPYPGAFYHKDGRKIIVWAARLVKNPQLFDASMVLEFSDGHLLIEEWSVK